MNVKNIKKEKDDDIGSSTSGNNGKKGSAKKDEYKKTGSGKTTSLTTKGGASIIGTKKESSSVGKKPSGDGAKPTKKEKEDDELKGLEEMYYGILDGQEKFYEEFPMKPITKMEEGTMAIYATHVECPICDTATTFDSNEKLQTHLVSHLNIDGKNHNLQCLFCLEKMDSESVLAKHNSIMHPEETKSSNSASYRCLICFNRFNSLNFLTSHLQNKHSMLELPYHCQACGYRTSSHRDAIRHYYDDHKHHNFLQCPHCLDVSSTNEFSRRQQVQVSRFLPTDISLCL